MTGGGRSAEPPGAAEVGVVLALTLLGAALRFHRLGEWSLWLDEILVLTHDIQHNWFLRLLMAPLLTDGVRVSEATARLIPCLAGVVTVPVLWWASRRPFGSAIAVTASGSRIETQPTPRPRARAASQKHCTAPTTE